MKLLIGTLLLLTAPMAHAGCNADTSNYTTYEPSDFGGGGPIKLFHVKGTHYCQSMKAFYSCETELRDATDCQNGHIRLQQYPNICCKQTPVNGEIQKDGMSINYLPGSCSPLF